MLWPWPHAAAKMAKTAKVAKNTGTGVIIAFSADDS
jgi:hypothetical protein